MAETFHCPDGTTIVVTGIMLEAVPDFLYEVLIDDLPEYLSDGEIRERLLAHGVPESQLPDWLQDPGSSGYESENYDEDYPG